MLIGVIPDTVLFALEPATLVDAAIDPGKLAFTVPFVSLKLAYILVAVGPPEMPLSLHLVINPLAGVLFFIDPEIVSHSLDLIKIEYAMIEGPISKNPSLVFS